MVSSLEEMLSVLNKWKTESTRLVYQFAGSEMTVSASILVREVLSTELRFGIGGISIFLKINQGDKFDYQEPHELPDDLKGVYISSLQIQFASSEAMCVIYELPSRTP
jgi:hypothetical protein